MSELSLEILVEELSAERTLRELMPKIAPGVGFEILVFRGKPDLLKKLPDRLAGYAGWILGANTCVVVLVDRDRDDCRELRERLDTIATDAGLSAHGAARVVLNRIAIEELEAWFFGDADALRAAFSRIPASIGSEAKYRDPDAIAGGTAEALERLLIEHNYHRGGLRKVAAAQEIAPYMDVENNRSHSFQVFRDGIRSLAMIGDG